MKFTLVTTVFNEARRLDKTLSDISNQTVLPTELIVVDAGSKDATIDILNKFKETASFNVQIEIDPGCNVAEGRNKAIELATHDLIVSTDFGCEYHKDWLKSMTQPFKDDLSVDVVGGNFTVQEERICTLASKADWILQDGYQHIMTIESPISSRSIAYKKQVWKELKGYPEWLTLAADDLVYWKKMKKKKFHTVISQKPYVYWGRHSKHQQFGKEAYRYGLGDGESHVNQRNVISNTLELLLRYLFFLWIISLPLSYALVGAWSIFGLLSFPGLRSYIYTFKKWNKWRTRGYGINVLKAALYQLELSRWMYLKGYLKGYFDHSTAKKTGREELKKELTA